MKKLPKLPFNRSFIVGLSDPTKLWLLGEVFSDREQLADFIQRNIPFCVKPTKKAKTAFVSVFTSENAMRVVIEELTDRLWDKLS